MAAASRSAARSLLALTRRLVRTPSRAGIDDYRPIAAAIGAWLQRHRVPHRLLRDDRGRVLGVEGRIGAGRAPAWLLGATADTAPFGDLAAWTHPSLSAAVDAGWLHGRGAADSKSGVAIFCHVLAALAARERAGSRPLRQPVAFLFDLDEHGGSFAGMRRWLAARAAAGERVAGAYIGYPGDRRLVRGCRGFLRATVTVHGIAAHSGASRPGGVNAIGRAAELVAALQALALPRRERGFGPGPKLTVTGVRGGEGDSLVPDRCAVDLDLRLTPGFGEREARALLAFCLALGLAVTLLLLWPGARVPQPVGAVGYGLLVASVALLVRRSARLMLLWLAVALIAAVAWSQGGDAIRAVIARLAG